MRNAIELSIGHRRIAQHHTLIRPDYDRGLTYGGLHETEEKALQEKAFRTSIRNALKAVNWKQDPLEVVADIFENIKTSEGWKNALVIELKPGQEYHPWRTGGTVYEHGVDDGTHGAPLKNAHLAEVLRPEK